MKWGIKEMKNRFLLSTIVILLLVIAIGYVYFDKQLESKNPVVATINGEEIRESELITELKRVYGKETLNEIINRRVVNIAAEKYGLKTNKEEINRQYNEFKKDYDSEEDFLAYLNEQLGWTKLELYEYIEYYTLWEELATKDINISEDELLNHYNENIFKYKDPEKYHIQQIIVETKEEAETVLKELNNGANFDILAKERSIDVFSLGNGGDLGMITEDDPTIDPEIINKAKSMDIGKISLVELNGAYAVIQLLDRKEGIQYSYDEVKKSIKRELSLNQVYSLPEVLEQLKAEMNVQINDSILK